MALNDRAFGAVFKAPIRPMGIRDRPTPAQNSGCTRMTSRGEHDVGEDPAPFLAKSEGGASRSSAFLANVQKRYDSAARGGFGGFPGTDNGSIL